MAREKCWSIQEKLPIKVKVSHDNNRLKVFIGEGVMTYKTFEHLDMNHLHEEIGVSCSCYDYENGECIFSVKSMEDFHKWVEFYKDFITL